MKTITFKTLFGSFALGCALFAAPVATYALDAKATSTASVRINHDGIVRILGAEVTSISGNIINAVTRFKNSILHWTFTTNASTTIKTTGVGATSTPADMRVGDRIAVTGTVTALGSPVSVQATSIVDKTLLASWKVKAGEVQSINTSNGTFVMKQHDKAVTVQTNAATTFKLGSTSSPSTLGNLSVGSKVYVYGTSNADGTVVTAVSVTTKTDLKDWKKEWKNHWKHSHADGKRNR